jgi:3-phosphoshikimate 1-carboxyvinyltransferase
MTTTPVFPAFLDLEPWQQGSFHFETALPGSKSLTLRDCAIAALADGRSTIRFPGEADDYWRMKDCLRRLGIAVDDAPEEAVVIQGRGGQFGAGRIELDVGQSAVTARLMLALAALRPDVTVIDGHISMQKRPNKDLVDALRALGAGLDSTHDGYLPTSVRGTRALRGPARVSGTISSQYLTSKPYLDLTLDEMAKFGVTVDNQRYQKLIVAQQPYRAGTIDVEGDASAASYFAALAILHGARITLTNLGSRTRQGDYAFFGLCEQLGARVTRGAAHTVIEGPARLEAAFAAPVDMTSMPDVAPTLMMIAPFLKQATRITGLATLRVKECDRIAAPTRELRKLGVEVEEGPDSMVIQPLSEAALATGARRAVVEIETYHDHRIAMCFGVLGSRLPGLRILDPGCVAKTYPNYWRDWQRARSVPR